MNADDIITNAMGGAGKMTGGPGTFVVEASAESNLIRTTPFEEAFHLNHWCFTEGRPMPYMFLGLCSSKEAAEELVLKLRTLVRDEEGRNLLSGKG